MKLLPVVLSLGLLACSPGNEGEASFPTGSSTIVTAGRQVYTVSPWDETLSMVDWQTGATSELALPGRPTRLARVGEDELWVTLRGERAVVVFQLQDGALPVERARVPVGAEPHGIVASADGSRVYVAVSQADQVVELDGATRDVLRKWKVQDDPRWLALHPSGVALFVVSALDEPLSRIDLESGEISLISPPETTNPQRPKDGGDVVLTPRWTGDPTISPRGDALIAPIVYADTTTPVEQPDDTKPPASGGGYSSDGATDGTQLGIGRLNPALVGVPLHPGDGTPKDDEPVIAFFVSGKDANGTHRGYVSSATFDVDGARVYATMEAADTMAVVDLRPSEDQDDLEPSSGTTFGSRTFHPPADGGFHERSQLFVATDGNPSGVALDPDGYVWVHERGGRSVSWSKAEQLSAVLDGDEDVANGRKAHRVGGRHVVGESWLDAEVEEGRRLFFSATDSRMAADGAGVSCGTCHFEGRNDGFTWTFEDGVRNTPSLAGPAAQTAPVTWTLDVPSVANEAQITSSGRMGGTGLTDGEAFRIEAFVAWQQGVDTELRGSDDELVRLGSEVFARPEVGCAECHGGAYGTDDQHHAMFGLSRVNTPSLVGVSATAPYLHDGSAPTLRVLLERVRDGSMGDTSSLDDREMDALEAYLRSL